MSGGIADWLIATAGVVGALVVIWKGVVPLVRWTRVVGRKAGRMFDVVLGTPAIPDPDRPGEVLRPEIPDIGRRVAGIEDTLRGGLVELVAEAKAHAAASEESSRAAERFAQAAAESAAKVQEIPERIAELAATVERWQAVDRTKAEVGTAVIAELARDKSGS